MATTKQLVFLAAATAIGLGTHAPAQTIQGGFELRVSNVVSPSQPTATVEVWAWFDNVPGVSEVFGAANFDLVASEEGWSRNFVYPLRTPDPGGWAVVNGASISGISTGQLHLPPLGIFGDPSNPIQLFAAQWSTADFMPRSVSLDTTNTNSFFVSDALTGATVQVWPNVAHGAGLITVVPAPSSLLVAVGAIAAVQRRRRPT